MQRDLAHEIDVAPPRRGRPACLIAQAGCAVALVATLSVFARDVVPPQRPGAIIGAATAVPPGFVPSAAVLAERPRLDPATGRREDTLSQGAFAVIEEPYLRLTVTDGAFDGSPSLFVILARRAADGRGLFVLRTGERGRLDSRFGPVETVEATLKAVSGDGASRICTAFVTLASARLQVDGWLCAPLGRAPEPRAIACALDKLTQNGQALPDQGGTLAQAPSRPESVCASPPPPAATRTGSIDKAWGRHEVTMRRSAQARP